ncbi:MAG: hypothetical protein HETSPECPRED_006207 [Heterodermia speciosa]|uniref:Uncharacterized protein n=1 Tax=Heterodermia speciosa TaxID=116794 RepID=A0A8H3FJW9_9LECA|nr:MAG: hypothetical protein HETSPECPRED_006207 [Heterodermia speciosa]
MPKPKHSKQRARIAKKKEKGQVEKAENDSRAARKHERAIMHLLVNRKHPKHGGLEPARVDDLAKALETPEPLPSTPEETEADLQRRGAAMAEINAAIEKLPDKDKRDIEMLRARKSQTTRHRVPNTSPSPRPTIEKDLLGPQKWRKKVTKTGQGDAKSVEDDGPRYGEPYNVTKEEWEEEHWNKTRTLREEEQRMNDEAEEARRTEEHEAFMKEMMAEVEEAERF